MKIETLDDVLVHEIQDLYSAEKQIIAALPKMTKICTSKALREALEEHLEQTREHVIRLEQAAEELKVKTGGEKCKGMEGLLQEGAKLLEEDQSYALDAAIISAAQRVEHYEIAGYGSALAFALALGEENVAELLRLTLEDEENADETLSHIADVEVTIQARVKTEKK